MIRSALRTYSARLIGPRARQAGRAASAASTARTCVGGRGVGEAAEHVGGVAGTHVGPGAAGRGRAPDPADEIAEVVGADREMINHGSYLGIGAGIRQDRSSAWK